VTYRILEGDCLEQMAAMPAASVDAVVCDPPYGLGFMGKEWDGLPPGLPWAQECLRVLKPGGHLLAFGGTRTYHRLACAIEDAGFEIRDTIAWLYGQGFPKSLNVGCKCDGNEAEPTTEHDLRSMQEADLSPSVNVGDQRGEVLFAGVSKPGSSGNRAVPLEGASGRNESSVEGWRHVQAAEGEPQGGAIRALSGVGASDGASGRLRDGAPAGDSADGWTPALTNGVRPSSGSRPVEQHAGESRTVANEPGSQDGRGWPLCPRCGKPPAGLGTALKPAHEPVVVARKPLTGTVAANVLEHGTGALNVDGCRVEAVTVKGAGLDVNTHLRPSVRRTSDENSSSYSIHKTEDAYTVPPSGRWPANVVLDPEAAELLDAQTGELTSTLRGKDYSTPATNRIYGARDQSPANPENTYADSGGASRFFYVAKASRAERNAGLDGFEERLPDNAIDRASQRNGEEAAAGRGSLTRPMANVHPTVKPIALMRWLVRLVTPPGGTVLDPFTGSGTTGIAAVLEGFDFIGIEREAEYVAIARARIAHWAAQPVQLGLEAA
jgi:DNA modification methylase